MSAAASIVVPLGGELADLLAVVSRATGMPSGEIVRKLMLSHVTELHEFAQYLRELPNRPARAQELAPWALQNYGPSDLMSAVRGFDPEYRSDAGRFKEGPAA